MSDDEEVEAEEDEIPNPRFVAISNWDRLTDLLTSSSTVEEAVSSIQHEFDLPLGLAHGVLDTPLRYLIEEERNAIKPTLRPTGDRAIDRFHASHGPI